MKQKPYTFSSNTEPQPSAPSDPSLEYSAPVPATNSFFSSLPETVTASLPSHPATSHLFSSQVQSADGKELLEML